MAKCEITNCALHACFTSTVWGPELGKGKKNGGGVLTVPGHPHGKAFFKSTVLTPVPIQSNDEAFPVPEAPVFDLFLYASPEEPLKETTTQLLERLRVCDAFRRR